MNDVKKLSRRHFLVGAGGATVAIPFLSSVLPRETAAQSTVQKRFVGICTDHGGVYPENLLPAEPASWSTRTFHAATSRMPRHDVRAGALVAESRDGRAVVSRCLEASAGLLTPALLAKLNVVTGLSVTTYLAHQRGMMLGNYAARTGDGTINQRPMATIDQLLARSPKFALSQTRERSFNWAIGYGAGSGVDDAASADTVRGVVSAVPAETDPRVLWDRFFAGSTGGAAAGPRRELVVDRVYEHYRALSTGASGDAARLSAADRRRLEGHMERLLELERALSVRIECGGVARPERLSGRERLHAAVDLAAAALVCGATHVAVLTLACEDVADATGYTSWHEQIAHNGGGNRTTHDPRFQRINYEAQGTVFREGFLRLAAALDEEESAGETYLDRSLLLWTHESGSITHDNRCMTAVTAGGAAGAVRTGQFIDYRNLANRSLLEPDEPETYPGVLYNQFLANLMRAMGLEPEDWHPELERAFPEKFADGARGYGGVEYHANNFWRRPNLETDLWPFAYYERADEPLPFFLT